MDVDELAGVLRQALGAQKATPYRAALDAGLPGNAIRSVLDGHDPTASRLSTICDGLGLEFYIGPPRPGRVADPKSSSTPWPVPVGPQKDGYSPAGCMWFTKGFLNHWGFDPTMCETFTITDQSMEPVLAKESVVLIDLCQRVRRENCIYLVRTDDGPVVRWATRDREGRWLLGCDNPAWEDAPWPSSAVVEGRIVWTAKMLMRSPAIEAAA